MAFLRTTWAIMLSIYMDDIILQADSPEKAYFHAQLVILVFLCLGWELNWEKSSITPSQTITHLGFIINTFTMTASCPEAKVERLRTLAFECLQANCMTVHEAERLLGQMESV